MELFRILRALAAAIKAKDGQAVKENIAKIVLIILGYQPIPQPVPNPAFPDRAFKVEGVPPIDADATAVAIEKFCDENEPTGDQCYANGEVIKKLIALFVKYIVPILLSGV